MKCPHCDYEAGWSGEILDNVEGKEGDFYKSPVNLERESHYTDRVVLYGCPVCKKTFIGD
jgi:hypothetical protein